MIKLSEPASVGRKKARRSAAPGKTSKPKTTPRLTRQELHQIAQAFPKPDAGRITALDGPVFQATIVRARQPHRRYFSLSHYQGEAARAHNAARMWLAAKARSLPPAHRLRDKPQPGKSRDLPSGVSTYSSWNSRTEKGVWICTVHFHDGVKARNKTFRIGEVGVVDEPIIEAVERIAIAFRADYEKARNAEQTFDPSPWRHWREMLPESMRDDIEGLKQDVRASRQG